MEKITFRELCGDQEKARMDFLRQLSEITLSGQPLSAKERNLALFSWLRGFIACCYCIKESCDSGQFQIIRCGNTCCST